MELGEAGVEDARAQRGRRLERTHRVWARSVVAISLLGGLFAAAPASAQLSTSLEVGPDPVVAGGILETALTVSNLGAGAVANVSLELALPAAHVAGFHQNLTTANGTCTGSGNLNANCDGGETITWVLGSLAAGERKTVSAPPQVFSTLLDGTVVSFTGRAFAGAVLQSSDADSITVRSAAPFELALDESADPAAPGADLTYTASFGNRSAGNAPGTTLTLALPAGTSFVSASDGGIFAAGEVTWDLGTLAAGEGGTRQAVVQVDTPATEGALLGATAQIQAPTLIPASAETVTVVQSGSPLALEIEASPDPAVAGRVLDVHLTVANLGASTIDPVLELRLPPQVAAFNENLLTGDGVCTISGDLNASCELRERVQWDLPPLAPGERITVSLPPQLFSTLISGLVVPLRAEVFEPLGGAVGLSQHARTSLLVDNTPVFEVALDESADPVAPGADLTYTGTFSNQSAGNALGTTLTLALPAGTSFVSASDGGIFAAGEVTWNLGTLPAGQGGTRQAVVHVDTPATEGHALRAVARIRDAAPSANTARATAVTVVQSGSPLALEVEASPDPAVAGRILDVHLTVANLGASTIDPVLELRLPPQVAGFNQNLLTGGGVCTISGNLNANCDLRERVQWDLLPLAPGERITVTLPPQLFSTLISATVVPFRAEVFEPLGGQTGVSRFGRQSLLVRNPPELELTLDESPDPVGLGGDVTYVATFGNPSAATAVGTTLSLPLPPGTSFVSATGGGVFTGSDVTWSLGSIPTGRGGRRQATLRLDPGIQAGDLLRAVATIRDSAASPHTARAVAVTGAQSSPPLHLSISATPNPAAPANFLDVQYTTTNNGVTTLTGVPLEARVPGVVAFAQASATGSADCTVSGNLNTNCDLRERVQWTLADLAPATPVTVSIPPQIFATYANGNLIPFSGFVEGSQAWARHTVRIGIVEDQDGDGLSDWLDNCPGLATPSQSDTGTLAPAVGPDGIGDACQCGDANNSGQVNATDGLIINQASLNIGVFSVTQGATVSRLTPPFFLLGRCNVTSPGPGTCNSTDALLINRASLGLSAANAATKFIGLCAGQASP